MNSRSDSAPLLLENTPDGDLQRIRQAGRQMAREIRIEGDVDRVTTRALGAHTRKLAKWIDDPALAQSRFKGHDARWFA
ncbi:MAG TPA: hypothetical protein VES20_23580, partial [Bryobacteraceae bacterium]|nr:hypothetical protein [Bryobacteraceae bacterium]